LSAICAGWGAKFTNLQNNPRQYKARFQSPATKSFASGAHLALARRSTSTIIAQNAARLVLARLRSSPMSARPRDNCRALVQPISPAHPQVGGAQRGRTAIRRSHGLACPTTLARTAVCLPEKLIRLEADPVRPERTCSRDNSLPTRSARWSRQELRH
jgi:hypothetical protein